MKVTAILAIVLCLVFLVSLSLIGCKNKKDDYYMGGSEYDSLISGIESGKPSLPTSSDEDGKDVTPPPADDDDANGDEIEDDASSQKPTSGNSSKKPSSSSSKPEESSSSKPGISTSRPSNLPIV